MRARSFTSNFKRTVGLLAFCLIVGVTFVQAGKRYEEAASHNLVNLFTKTRFDDFYALEENTLDMVFIGSSHAYCTFDPENFDSVLGTLSFQMGTPLQHPDTSYFELLEVLKTQSPSVVVMEVYWDVLDDSFDMQQADSFFEVVKEEITVEEYIDQVFPVNEKVKYDLKAIRYQQDYFAYESSQMENEVKEKYGLTKKASPTQEGIEEYRSKGYVYCDMQMLPTEYDETNQFKNFDGKDWEMDDTQMAYMDKIVELCRQRGIQLVFVTAPVANVSMEYIQNYDLVHEKVAQYAAENNVPYLDFNIVNQEEGLFTNENFRDDAHLNDSGVKIADAYFIDWLKAQGIF